MADYILRTIFFVFILGQIQAQSYTNPRKIASVDLVDTTYTSASPLSLPANTKLTLYNHVDIERVNLAPLFLDSLYNRTDSTIIGVEPGIFGIVIEFKVRPTTATVPRVNVTIDIGGIVGEIYPSDFTLTKGVGVEHYYLSSFIYYTRDTWEANGGKVKIESFDAASELYDLRFVITPLWSP